MTQENITKLRSFIVDAHLNTHANEITKPEKGDFGKKIFKYSKDNFTYQDEHVAKDHFIGQEIIYRNYVIGGGSDGVPGFDPIWSMAYRKRVFTQGIKLEGSSKEIIYAFLREALRAVDTEHTILPVRGPRSFRNGSWLYKNDCEDGDILSFSGREVIAFGSILVYECHYLGGGFTLD